jgi:hypothetical protein
VTASPGDEAVLNYYPWAGDESDVIPPRSRVRAQTEVYEGQCMTFRFCSFCCAAMAARYDDDGQALEQRTEIGMRLAPRAERVKP